MVDGGKITLRFEIDNEQFKRILQEINKDLDKFKQKTTEASSGADKLGTSVKNAGEQSASAAINFQTMTQGAINLTTSFAQTYASVSNIQRAHTSLAQSMVSLDRAEDQLQRKQFKLNQEMAKAVPNMEKVNLLQNEIATAMDDYAVKQQKVKDTQDQLNDTQMLFAVNLVNVGFSAIQTGKSMLELGKSMNIAATASAIFNSTMGKVALIATAVILAMEGITAVARAMNLEWADQIPSLSNLGKKINETFTTSDQILVNSKKNVVEYGESWKDSTKVLKTETDSQLQIVSDWQRAIKRSVLETQQSVSRKSLSFNFAPEKGATEDIGTWWLPGAYGAVSSGRKNNSQMQSNSIDITDWFRETSRIVELRKKSGLGGDIAYIPYGGLGYGNPVDYNKEYFETSTVDIFGNESIINKLNKQYNNYKRSLIELQSLDIPEELRDYIAITTELKMMDIEDELKKYNITPNKSGKPNLADLTPDTSFSGISDSDAVKGYADESMKQFKLAREFREKMSNPAYRSQRNDLLRKYLQAKQGAYQLADLARGAAISDFDLGTNTGRGISPKNGMGGVESLFKRLRDGGNPDVLRALNNSRVRVNLGGQVSKLSQMFSGGFGGFSLSEITGKQSEQIMNTLSMTLGGMKSALRGVAGSPFNIRGPRGTASGVFSGPSSSSASRIAGLTAGSGAARKRSGGHSQYRGIGGGLTKFNVFTVQPALLRAGFDGFDLGVSRAQFTASGRGGTNLEAFQSAFGNAFERAIGSAGEYSSLLPVSGFDPSLSNLDNFESLYGAINNLRNWRTKVQDILALSFQNQAAIEVSAGRGRDELEDRLRFQERLAKISTGSSSI